MELPIILSNLSAVTGPSSAFKYSCFRLLERNTQLKQNPKEDRQYSKVPVCKTRRKK